MPFTSLSAMLLCGGYDVKPSSETPPDPSAGHDELRIVDTGSSRTDAVRWDPTPDPAGEFVASAGTRRMLRLVAGERYFGLAARAFHAGAQKMLERISAQALDAAHVDLYCISTDFQLEPADSLALLRAMLAGGLLLPAGTGQYRPTPRFREHALAPLVAPLSRARARMLVDAVCDVAAQINADWARNPFEVKMLAVSGGYMSRSEQLSELSLWLVLRPRREQQMRRWRSRVSKGEGLRQILAAVSSQSSFIVARIVAHKSVVPRPFCVAFQATESFAEVGVSASQRVREWGASIGELLGADYYASSQRGRELRNRRGGGE
jgi:hypothetical protein